MSEEEFRKETKKIINRIKEKYKVNTEEMNILQDIIINLKKDYMTSIEFLEMVENMWYLAPCPPEPKIGEIL